MTLYLAESVLPQNLRERALLEQATKKISAQASEHNSALIEVQVAEDLSRAFFIFESTEQQTVRNLLTASEVPVTLVKQVRLLGQELEDLRKNVPQVKYLVEWNLPEGLTMDAYLNRKKENSVGYANVPEVTFERTYVCEDMTKCLCLYQAPKKEDIYRAREAVKAPVDAITETVTISVDK
jgi:hypothetical protein